MGLLWMTLRIVLLGYERIAGNKISKNAPTFVAAWAFFFFSFLSFAPFIGSLSLNILLKSLISGTIYSLSFSLYTYALGHEDASVVAPLYNLNAIFLVILSALFLGESFSLKKLLGAILMIYGVSYLKKGENFVISYKNLIIVVIASLLSKFYNYMEPFLNGMKAPLFAVLLVAVIKMWKTNINSIEDFIIFIVSFSLVSFLKLNPVYVILLGILYAILRNKKQKRMM